MFLFLSDELDFKQLSDMAEEVERYKVRASMTGAENTDNRSLNITDMYGFIRDKSEAFKS